tara:strand:- start:230 stop:772 length:543 start_codon:yes stop_codon:yes gene_type:complete
MSMVNISVEGMDSVIKLLNDMRTVGDKRHRQIKREMAKAAAPMEVAVKASIRDGETPMKSTMIGRGTDRKSGLTKHLKVDYKPGNLRRSIDVFPTRKGLAVHVGARFGRKARSNADGYYSGMVQFGVFGRAGKKYKNNGETRHNVGYADKAYAAGLSATQASMLAAVNKIIEKYITGPMS